MGQEALTPKNFSYVTMVTIKEKAHLPTIQEVMACLRFDDDAEFKVQAHQCVSPSHFRLFSVLAFCVANVSFLMLYLMDVVSVFTLDILIDVLSFNISFFCVCAWVWLLLSSEPTWHEYASTQSSFEVQSSRDYSQSKRRSKKNKKKFVPREREARDLSDAVKKLTKALKIHDSRNEKQEKKKPKFRVQGDIKLPGLTLKMQQSRRSKKLQNLMKSLYSPADLQRARKCNKKKRKFARVAIDGSRFNVQSLQKRDALYVGHLVNYIVLFQSANTPTQTLAVISKLLLDLCTFYHLDYDRVTVMLNKMLFGAHNVFATHLNLYSVQALQEFVPWSLDRVSAFPVFDPTYLYNSPDVRSIWYNRYVSSFESDFFWWTDLFQSHRELESDEYWQDYLSVIDELDYASDTDTTSEPAPEFPE